MEQEIQVIKEELEKEIQVQQDSLGTIPTGTKQITENGTYDVYNYKYANVNTPMGLDWTALGFSGTPTSIVNGYNYALEIKNNWVKPASLYNYFAANRNLVIMPLVDISNMTNMMNTFQYCQCLIEIAQLDTSSVTNMQNSFQSSYSLKKVPQLNTSNVTNMQGMFQNCYCLVDVPAFNVPKVQYASNMFKNCYLLSNDSLDNILKMCISATSYRDTKALTNLGLSSSNYPASTIQSLPSYQAFINAGWTIGY